MARSHDFSIFTAVITVSCVVIQVHGFVKISPYLHACTKHSPDLNNCIKGSLSTLITNLRTGDDDREILAFTQQGSPELGLPALDPMIITQVKSGFDDGTFELNESFNNVFMFGFCDIQINTVKLSLQQDKVEITSKIPFLSFQGHYNSNGEVMDFHLDSLGAFEVNFTDVTSIWIIYFKRTSVNGTTYLQVDQLITEMIPLSVNINVAQRIDGSNKLEQDQLNAVLNESSSELFIHVKPKLLMTLNQIFTTMVNDVLKQFPEDVLLPK